MSQSLRELILRRYRVRFASNPEGVLTAHIDRKTSQGKSEEEALKGLIQESEQWIQSEAQRLREEIRRQKTHGLARFPVTRKGARTHILVFADDRVIDVHLGGAGYAGTITGILTSGLLFPQGIGPEVEKRQVEAHDRFQIDELKERLQGVEEWARDNILQIIANDGSSGFLSISFIKLRLLNNEEVEFSTNCSGEEFRMRLSRLVPAWGSKLLYQVRGKNRDLPYEDPLEDKIRALLQSEASL